MEIEEGEWVRTDRGIIDKVIINYYGICNSPNCNCKHVNCEKDYYDEEDIVKHSKDIIDLIEDTDILQVEISEEWVVKENTLRFIIVGQTYTIEEIKEALENGMYNIKQILTHEQYSQNCYRLEE